MKKEQPPLVHPSLRGMKYVIFPRNPYVQHWDNFFLCVLLYYCFSIPYVVGVSGGYRMYANSAWFVVNMLLNVFYFGEQIVQVCKNRYLSSSTDPHHCHQPM